MADYFDTLDISVQKRFNRDGTLKDRDLLIACGRKIIVDRMEADMKLKLELYGDVDREWKEKYGESASDRELKARVDRAEYNRKFPDRQKQALANGEDLSELPEHIDQDDYYDLIDF
jgi:hypothetical protein